MDRVCIEGYAAMICSVTMTECLDEACYVDTCPLGGVLLEHCYECDALIETGTVL